MSTSIRDEEDVLRQPSHTEKKERKKRHKTRADIDLEDDKKASLKDEKKKKKKLSHGADERKNDPATTTTETEELPPHKKSKKRKPIEVDNDTVVPKKRRKSTTTTTTSEHPDPSKDDTLSDQSKKAISYVHYQTTDAQTWKFNKAKQNWIIRNLWSSQAIPEKYESLVIQYLSKVQGRVKETLIEACKKCTTEGDAEDKRQRAQTLLNALTIDT